MIRTTPGPALLATLRRMMRVAGSRRPAHGRSGVPAAGLLLLVLMLGLPLASQAAVPAADKAPPAPTLPGAPPPPLHGNRPATAAPSILNAIAARTATDAWAVGSYDNRGVTDTLIEHWDGAAWTVMPSPNVGTVGTSLTAVVALAANDAWAVGAAGNDYSGRTSVVVLHWDGSTWQVVTAPAPSSSSSLSGLVALAADNIWAVGRYSNGTDLTLIEHWNGTIWSQVASPNSSGSNNRNDLTAVSAQAAGDVWAVGSYFDAALAVSRTLIEHWDGSAWTIVPSPSPRSQGNGLSAVTVISLGDVWAAGSGTDSGDFYAHATLLHWNGTAWTVATAPNTSPDGETPAGISGAAAGDVWAAGTSGYGSTAGSLLLHWNGSAWTQVPAPSAGSYMSYLNGIQARTAGDIWAVGSYALDSSGLGYATLILHWNGTAWTVIPSPNGTLVPTPTPSPPPAPSAPSTVLNAVSGRTAADVWAVGSFGEASNTVPRRSLTEHWDGSTWTVIPSPNLTAGNNDLAGVAAVAANDVWAVGSYRNLTVSQALISHWDGSAWHSRPGPYAGPDSYLNAVSARTANDIWAVGSAGGYSLTVHWDGALWQAIPSPNVAGGNYLTAVTALAANDVWAVGYNTISGAATQRTLIEHWDGSAWSVVPSPNLGSSNNSLLAVTATGSTDVWAVGDGDNQRQTLVLHWTGSAWAVVASPNPGSYNNQLRAVTAVGPGDLWAVGTTNVGTALQPLAEHWNGTAWSVVYTPHAAFFNDELQGVTALATGDVWAVGSSQADNEAARINSLIEHWNGTLWQGVNSPNGPVITTGPPVPLPYQSYLHGVAGHAAGDAWAVGHYSDGSRDHTLTEHWDGTAWSIIPSPRVAGGNSVLLAVAAPAAANAWAVGYTVAVTTSHPLIEHWDGTAWAIIPSPNGPGEGGRLAAITAVSPTDMWAAGTDGNNSLLEHWNGSAWTVIPSPQTGTQNILTSLAAISSNDIWAVGYQVIFNGAEYENHLLFRHWNGTSWLAVPEPPISNPYDGIYLLGLTALASNDVWAVGALNSSSLTLHWNGSAWSRIPSPNLPTGSNTLAGVVATAANSVWAVGYYTDHNIQQTLTMHWDGSAWNLAPSVNVGGRDNAFAATTAFGGQVWAVGSTLGSIGRQPLIERRDTAGWTLIPSPNSCPAFSDVPPSNPFYSVISALTCRGVVGGYSDGTFQPGANVTRGQMAKFTANAAGFTEVYTTATFTDVPVGSTFHPYVERLVRHEVVGGYTDPARCPTGVPCFRPGDPVTRGQVAQFVAAAHGYAETYSTATFNDVPRGSTFFLPIQQLQARGIIGGYSDAAHCPGGAPCFQPSAPATRGQIAKFVANAFFPPSPTGPLRGDPPKKR